MSVEGFETVLKHINDLSLHRKYKEVLTLYYQMKD